MLDQFCLEAMGAAVSMAPTVLLKASVYSRVLRIVGGIPVNEDVSR